MTPVKELDLDLQWITLYAIDPFPKKNIDEELSKVNAKGNGKGKAMDIPIQGMKALSAQHK